MGALVALDAKLKPSVVGLFAAAARLLHGYLNGASLQNPSVLTLARAVTAAFCLFAILAAQVTTIRVG